MRKRLVVLGLLTIFLVSMVAVSVDASLGSKAGGALDKILGMFSKKDVEVRENTGMAWYDNNAAVIDFFIFFLLFLGSAALGLKKQMKEGGGAAKGIAIALAAALAIAAMRAGMGVSFFIPFVKNLVVFGVVIAVFFVYNRLFGMKAGWSFALAVPTTLLLFFFFVKLGDSTLGTDLASGVTKEELECNEKLALVNNKIQSKLAEAKQLITKLNQEIPEVVTSDFTWKDVTDVTVNDMNNKIVEKYPPTKGRFRDKDQPKAAELKGYVNSLKKVIEGGFGADDGIKELEEDRIKLQAECGRQTTSVSGEVITPGGEVITQPTQPTEDVGEEGEKPPAERDLLKEALDAFDKLNK